VTLECAHIVSISEPGWKPDHNDVLNCCIWLAIFPGVRLGFESTKPIQSTRPPELTQKERNIMSQPLPSGPTRTFASWVAAGILLVWLVFLVFMWLNADPKTVSDPQWLRWVFLYGAIEALVFAAAGWIFGREVNRARAENAEKDAREAGQNAEGKTKEAADHKAKIDAAKRLIEAKNTSSRKAAFAAANQPDHDLDEILAVLS
jgi:hypothetical protein